MKKIMFIMVVFLLCSTLAGCNRNTSDKAGIAQNGVSENEKENEIHQIENMELLCDSKHLASCYTENGYYFVNVETGEMQNSPLVNKTLGWSLEFQAEIGSQVLLIYDYEADALGDGAYEITQYKYALLEKEDLYAGNANYHPIKMIGKGN